MRYISFLIVFILLGCNSNEVKLEDACNTVSDVCINLSVDNHCVTLRREVIIKTYLTRKKKTSQREYDQLIALERYVDCAEESTWIEFKDLKRSLLIQKGEGAILTKDDLERIKKDRLRKRKEKNNRIVSFQFGRSLLKELNAKTNNSNFAGLLYWHWTRNASRPSLEKLMELDKKGLVNDSVIMFSLAQEYARYDMDKSITKMISSLAKYPKDKYVKQKSTGRGFVKENKDKNENLHIQVLQSLSVLYFKQKDYKRSYLFTKILILNNNGNSNAKMITEYLKSDVGLVDRLDRIAVEMHNQLMQGKFKQSCKNFPKHCKVS